MTLTEEATSTEIELDPQRVAELIADGADLIDTRRDHEWGGARIPGARHIEVNELTAAAAALSRDRPLVFYCRTGSRSGMAAEAFRTAGYRAYSLAGGIRAWADAGLAIEPEGEEIRKPLPGS
jgi:rhodanese-related sulfurtransferase